MRRLRLTGQSSSLMAPIVTWCGQPEQITGIASVYVTTAQAGMAASAYLQWVDDCPCELADGCATLKAEREKGDKGP